VPAAVSGIHHVTAIASAPQPNLDFYASVLGLRLVKKTVNFDAPDVYHFYFGDEGGSPGTILTFFPFPDAARGERGTGEISSVALHAPLYSLGFWAGHLARHGVQFEGPLSRFGEEFIAFEDSDGLRLEIVFAGEGDIPGSLPERGGVPRESAIRRIAGVTCDLRDMGPTEELLSGMLGVRRTGKEGKRARFTVGDGAEASAIDIRTIPGSGRGRQSAGSVHHIAWRTPSPEDQREWRLRLVDAGLSVTEVLDRKYFQSIYFREPGGILFEIATDPPGFAVDEPPAALGSGLQLPAWLEAERGKIERILPTVLVPGTGIPER